ncbi:MAG: beta-ketoacyl-ACP synthase II [Aerococcus sp.]|nr:beta-ketoacyl-ACP synthase II [Aerococcus sp.]
MSRVVVTGMGAISAIGNDRETFLDNLFDSKVGIDTITKFDGYDEIGVSVAGEVKDFDPSERLDKRDARRNDLFINYALHTTAEAWEQSGLSDDTIAPEDLGVMWGSGIGGLLTIEEQVVKMIKKGPKRVSPFFIPNAIINMAAGKISIAYNAKNTSQGIVTACSSATNAIGNAYEWIKAGKAKVMVAGGSEAAIGKSGIAGFAALTALSTEPDPKRASIPFDKARNGFVMGEGSGTLILEDYDHAKARGANILAEITGYGSTSDAYHITAPDIEAAGAKRAMIMAVEQSSIPFEDYDYINAHGTSTQSNDSTEAQGIHDVFEGNDHLLVSSTKGMTGHALGAAGALEAVAVIGSLVRQQLPVNVGVQTQDDACPVELVSEENKHTTVRYALSNSLGFGGHNAVLAFKNGEE